MRRNTLIVGAAMWAALLTGSALAQLRPVQYPTGGVPGTTQTPNRRGRQEPCWQVAGISQSAMQQERTIQESARGQIESVCANSSLTAQQKHEQIRAIEEQTRRQVEGIITPQQHQALKSCRAQRGEGGHRGMRGGAHHGMGPCGEMPGATSGNGRPIPGTPQTGAHD
ncbi:MAG TPA: hypothetical protein VFA89_23250 [Terriglobales bacterium]|nr:hypothetical protein [Terriglobales bacterium]